MRRLAAIILGVAVIAAVVGYVASPYYAFHRLEVAAKAGDRDGLEDAVDFPAVREDFKSQINGALLAKVQGDAGLKSNPLAQLGLLIVPALVDRAIDSYVTPQGIAEMVTQARPPKPGGRPRADGDRPHVSFEYAYASPDRFKVTAHEDRRPDKPLVFVLERRGLFTWKLVRIELPLDGIGN